MRKRIITILMMICVLPAVAQLYVTPEVGISAFQNRNSITKTWNAGWKAGAAVEYQFKREGHFSLESGLYYANRTEVYQYYPYLSVSEKIISHSQGNSNNHYLHIPLLAKFHWKLAENVRISIAFGPYLALSLSNTGTVKSTYIDYSLTDEGYYWVGSSWNYGYGYGGYGGYGDTGHGAIIGTSSRNPWKDGNYIGLFAKLGIEYHKAVIGLTYDPAFGDSSIRGFGLDNHTIVLSVGYKFQLTK